jgi:hypothetical protein
MKTQIQMVNIKKLNKSEKSDSENRNNVTLDEQNTKNDNDISIMNDTDTKNNLPERDNIEEKHQKQRKKGKKEKTDIEKKEKLEKKEKKKSDKSDKNDSTLKPKKKKTNFVCSTYNLNDTDKMSNNDIVNNNIILQLNLKENPIRTELNPYDLYDEQKTERARDDNKPFLPDYFDPEDRNTSSNALTSSRFDDIFDNKFFEQKDEKTNNQITNLKDSENDETSKVIHLLKDFQDKNKLNEWPSSTNIACYWCCHKFPNEPYGIPIKYKDSKFHVFGCFCSLECSQAHNFSMKNETDEMWERCNLINFLSRRLKYNKQGIVKPAPSRLALKLFGGYLSIEEFRKFTCKDKMINVNFPPMYSVTQQIEEINQSEVDSDYKFIPIDTERINRYKEKLRLKRTKPLYDMKNTLDSAINIKISPSTTPASF